jgi:hypothetical protein
MRRRDFLTAAGATAALGWSSRASAAWGDAPSASASLLLGPGERAERCLELFLYGGMASFESFYVAPDYGRPDDANPAWRDTQWYLFRQEHARVYGDCGFGPESSWLTPFATDANGTMVHLGPMVQALSSRPDILARMRVVVVRHDFTPHEAAVPYAMTGLRLGNPRMAGLGTHIQRYHIDRASRIEPYSYVLSPTNDDPTFNTKTCTAVGQHPGLARPLQIVCSGDMSLGELLGRNKVGADAARVDPLLMHYAQRDLDRYVDPAGKALRARTLGDHHFAMDSLTNAPALAELLGGDLFVSGSGRVCGVTNPTDVSGMTIEAAVELLTHPTSAAKYVNVIDGGYQFYAGLAYDSHAAHVDTHSINQNHLWQALAAKINEPGEVDDRKLNLDDTLILINAEFGRTPFLQFAGGTNHHPYGYVAVMIGGPVQQGLYGAIGPDGNAEVYASPSEVKAACLAALGIYPFSAESFAVGDLQNAGSEAEGLAWLNENMLGRV